MDTPIRETRTKLFKMDELILDVHFALINEDYSDLQLTQEMVMKIWNDATPKFKGSFMRALVRNMYKLDVEDKKDLNGFFTKALGQEIPVFQPVRD